MTENRNNRAHGDFDVEEFIREQEERKTAGQMPVLFHDPEFESVPSSIDGVHNQNKPPKCRCNKLAKKWAWNPMIANNYCKTSWMLRGKCSSLPQARKRCAPG